jgi:hypothetical protein
MNSLEGSSAPFVQPAGAQATQDAAIAQLVAAVYESAPAAERSRLLEQLLRPLGVLSLFAVAGGIFANLRFRGGWPQLRIEADDIGNVRADHVVALVDYVQQVSVETVDGLAQWLIAAPVLSGSAATVLLVTMLVRRACARQSGPAVHDASPHPHRA